MDATAVQLRLAAWWTACLLLTAIIAPAGAPAAEERKFRLGHLAPSKASVEVTRQETLPELAKLGFSEGSNLVVLDRFGGEAAMPKLMQELLRAKVDVVIAIGPDAVRIAGAATKTVPIVVFGPDPVRMGLAASLARPGGNVTGVVILNYELDAKRLDLLHQAVPSARRVAALMMPSAPQRADSEREMRKFAGQLGLSLQVFDAARPADYGAAFAAMKAARAEALVIAANAYFYRDGARLVAHALQGGCRPPANGRTWRSLAA